MVRLRSGKTYGENQSKPSITYEEIINSTQISTIIYLINLIIIYLKPHLKFRISEDKLKYKLLFDIAINYTEEDKCYICGCNFSNGLENINIVYCHNKHYLHLECLWEKIKIYVSKNIYNVNTKCDFFIHPEMNAIKCDYCGADFVLNM